MVQVVTAQGAPRAAADPLDNLGAGLGLDDAAPDDAAAAEQARQQQEADAAMAAMNKALAKFTMGLLRAARARIAKTMPEILDEWQDADFEAVADAVPPIIQKRLSLLGPIIAKYPEEGALLLALVPIAMGYFNAIDKHSKARQQLKGAHAESEAHDTTGHE